MVGTGGIEPPGLVGHGFTDRSSRHASPYPLFILVPCDRLELSSDLYERSILPYKLTGQ